MQDEGFLLRRSGLHAAPEIYAAAEYTETMYIPENRAALQSDCDSPMPDRKIDLFACALSRDNNSYWSKAGVRKIIDIARTRVLNS
jgi:hypothetical protein